MQSYINHSRYFLGQTMSTTNLQVNGVGPDDACCACGGGSSGSSLTTTLTTTATTTPAATDPPCPTDPLEHFAVFLQKKALNNPLGIDLTCTLDECARQCVLQDECLTFTYRPSNSKCLLKRAVPDTEVWVVSLGLKIACISLSSPLTPPL